jgi:hypothetical protein
MSNVFRFTPNIARDSRHSLPNADEALGTLINGPISSPASDLVEMQRIPTGCLLIKMSVFEKLTRPYFRFETDSEGAIVGEDYVFCDRAREAGFHIWCDVTISRELGHLGQKIHRLSHASFPAVVADSTVAPPAGAQSEKDCSAFPDRSH